MASRTKPELSSEQASLLRRVPSVDELLLRPGLVSLCREVERSFVVETTREVLEGLRRSITSGEAQTDAVLNPAAIEQRIVNAMQKEFAPSLQPVINASGVILHTNLGRAPLSVQVVDEIRRTATQYSNLEYDLEAGARGKRDVHTMRLIERLTGDGFRIPEIMEQSGAVLREVGTTNRTRLADYENAIHEKTRLLLRVYPSNFTVTGFTEKPEVADLIALGARTGLPVVEDLGSGCLVDLSAGGITQSTVRESIAAGFSLVLFSADKLLGGPQAGIIAGKKELVAKVRRHPLFRALRVDKLTIAALEVTLRAYLRGAWNDIPSQRMIRLPLEEIAARTRKFHDALQPQAAASDAAIEIADGSSLIGGGSTPAQSLPTKVLRIASARHSAAQLEARLRQAPAGIPVIARIEDDRLLLDLRTVFPEQEPALLQSLVAALR